MAHLASGAAGESHLSGSALVRIQNRAASGNAFLFCVSLELPRGSASSRHRATLVARLEKTHAPNGTDLCGGTSDLVRLGSDHLGIPLAATSVFPGPGRRLPKFDRRSRAIAG